MIIGAILMKAYTHEFSTQTKVLKMLLRPLKLLKRDKVFPWLLPTGTINFRPYLPAGTKRGQVQLTSALSGVHSSRACTIEMHTTDVFLQHKYYRYVQCSTVREYRPARQAFWVVQVVLVASNECGCVPCGNYSRAELISFSSSELGRAGLIQR